MSEKVEKVKKRKRNTDGSSKPSKRVAIEGDKEIRISLPEADQWAPVIASTPGLALPTSLPLQPYTKPRKNPPSGPGRTAISKTELLLQSSAHQKLDYTAREEEAGGADTLLKHYVGVYDPETGKMEVMEARRMVVRGVVRAHKATADDEHSTDMRELRNTLGQTFGTKKARKAIASFTENAISPEKSAREANGKPRKIDSAAQAMISNIAEATAGMASRDELAAAADAAKPRPKPNVGAEDIKDVYTTDSLIGDSIMAHIPVREWAATLKAKKEVVTNSRFVSHRVAKVATNVEKLKILRYMLLALEILRVSKPGKGRDNRSFLLPRRDELKTLIGDMPEAVLQSFTRKFSDSGAISKFKFDLLITHLCAMACLVDNYEVDVWDLKEDLRLEIKPMAQYFNEIGCKIANFPEAERKRLEMDKAAAAQRRIAKLKLPLSFPKAAFARARK
ncbi:DNA-directed RNA polymerase I subunit [Lachnellula willkommii]|uniref:DNA-directed RNA polymerase I subunit n=1 Tax=Lachnellula willkommii TaxID=215461 RepID=A0A559M096_9HELO|nr:DNA-directed RNA polymerase I subunit [Lachnellula willkommii]